jgi:uridine phosphorylase
MSKPIITPAKLLGNKKFPIECEYAIMCFCPMPEILKQYKIVENEVRHFLHLHPMHVLFCKSPGGENFVVVAEQYGGPVAVSIVEELHHYGVSKIAALGFVGSFNESMPMGTNLVANKALIEHGTTPHYMRCDCSGDNYTFPSHSFFFSELPNATIWTHNAIYREYPEHVAYAKHMHCDVVNMDSSHFFASCKTVSIEEYFYVATVSDFMTTNEEWENNLSEVVAVQESKSHENSVETSQKKLIDLILNKFIDRTPPPRRLLNQIVLRSNLKVEVGQELC